MHALQSVWYAHTKLLHQKTSNSIKKTTRREFLSKTLISRPCSNRRKLVITEAILNKDKKPVLNSQVIDYLKFSNISYDCK